MKTKQILKEGIKDICTLLKYLYLGHTVTVPGQVEGTLFRFSMPNDDLSVMVEFKPNLGTGNEEFVISNDSAELITPQGLADIIDLLKELPADMKMFKGKDRFEEIRLIVAADMAAKM